VERGGHRHDGFYLRMSLGGGAFASDVEFDAPGSDNVALRGGGAAFDLLIGGSPSPGFVVGGGFLINTASDPDLETAGETFDTELTLGFALFGPFIDVFPDPEGGFHAGGMLGAASFSVNSDDDDDSDQNSSGWGGAVWLGYGGFVSSQWSLGGMLRFAGGVTRNDEDVGGVNIEQQVGTRTFSILFTALYH
jgi:hypothetical protein